MICSTYLFIYQYPLKWAKTTGILRYLCASQGTKFHLLLLSLTQTGNVKCCSFLFVLFKCFTFFKPVGVKVTQWLAAIPCMIRGLMLHNIVRTVVSSSYSYLHFNFYNVNQQNHQTLLFKEMSFDTVITWEGSHKASVIFLSCINCTAILASQQE